MRFFNSILFFMLWLEVIAASTDVCMSLGFNPLVLRCDTCKDLQRVVAETELYEDCLKCCVKNLESDSYEQAILEVDQRFISSFGNMDSIIKLIKELRTNKINKELIKIRYAYGSMPRLLLFKSKTNDDSPTETVSLQGWSTDDFSDYLYNHIKNINIAMLPV